MSWPPIQPVSKIIKALELSTATSGSACLAAFAAALKSTMAVVAVTILIAISAIAICLSKIVGSTYKRRATIIREKNVARVLRSEANTRHELAVADANPSKTEQAKENVSRLKQARDHLKLLTRTVVMW